MAILMTVKLSWVNLKAERAVWFGDESELLCFAKEQMHNEQTHKEFNIADRCGDVG